MAKARTAKQRAALRKAQLASARKRKGKRKGIKSRIRKNYKKNKTLYKSVALVASTSAAGYVARRTLRRTFERSERLKDYHSASKIMASNARMKFRENRTPGNRMILRTLTSRKSYAAGRKKVGRW